MDQPEQVERLYHILFREPGDIMPSECALAWSPALSIAYGHETWKTLMGTLDVLCGLSAEAELAAKFRAMSEGDQVEAVRKLPFESFAPFLMGEHERLTYRDLVTEMGSGRRHHFWNGIIARQNQASWERATLMVQTGRAGRYLHMYLPSGACGSVQYA